VSGRSTSMPCCMSGAVTMKITSSTSITSTNGVTLISELSPPCPPRRTAAISAGRRARARLAADARAARAQVGLELRGEEVDRVAELAQLADVVVVEDRGGNRGEQAHRRRDQRLGDAGRHDGEARAARLADLVERGDDADDGAEQADEGRRAAGRG